MIKWTENSALKLCDELKMLTLKFQNGTDVPWELVEAQVKANQRYEQLKEARELEEEKRWMEECSITVRPRITQFIDDIIIKIPVTHLDRWKLKSREDITALVAERCVKLLKSYNDPI